MRPRFNEKKTTQLAARVLELRATGKMHYIKLIKILYHVDREALKRWGHPLTYDYYVSMNQGPVLSNTLNLMVRVQRVKEVRRNRKARIDRAPLSAVGLAGIELLENRAYRVTNLKLIHYQTAGVFGTAQV